MQPKDWLTQFPGNKHQDGQALYRYRLSDAEFIRLQEMLELSTVFGVSGITKISGWNAVFVLYAAEWWRRNHDGGAWSWENIFASFDANANELNEEQRNLIVESGLNYWQRPVRVINGYSGYSLTIACEGGLPLPLLRTANDWLSGLLKHVIPKYLRLQNAQMLDAIRIICDCADSRIPQSHQNPAIYAVLADIVCMVAQLISTHQLADKVNPVDYLQQHVPDWQARFSLPLNDTVADKLLTELINSAAQMKTLPAPFRGRRILTDLHDTSGKLCVCVEFEFAAFIDLKTLVGAGRVADFPVRVAVDLVSDAGESTPIGMALKTTVDHNVVLEMPCYTLPSLRLAEFSQGYTLRFKHLSHCLLELPLLAAIDDSVPWTFVPDNDGWLLVGTASVRTSAEQVYILYANHLSCNATQMTELASFADKHLVAASGVVELHDANELRFCIQTAQTEATLRYELQGKKPAYALRSLQAVYLGNPELGCINTETEQRSHVITPLLARPVNRKTAWQPLSKQQGIYELCLQDGDGFSLFHKTCVLLPEPFALQFAFDGQCGRIAIVHNEHAYISCDSPLIDSIQATADGRTLIFKASDTPPVQLDLMLRWNKNDKLILSVPFPICGGQLINADGQSLTQVAIDQLHGVRLRLLGENQSRRIRLEFRLKDNTLNTRELFLNDEIYQTGAVLEFALSDYQQWLHELLAISSQASSSVLLTAYEQDIALFPSFEITRPAQDHEFKTGFGHYLQVRRREDINSLTEAMTIQNDTLRRLFMRHHLKQLSRNFADADWETLCELQNRPFLSNKELWTIACQENRVLVAFLIQLECDFMQRWAIELPVFWVLIPVKDWLTLFTRYKNYLAGFIAADELNAILQKRIDKISTLDKSLQIIAQILSYHLCHTDNSELALMQSEEAGLLISEQLQDEQRELIHRHTNNQWINLLSNAIFQQWHRLPDLSQNLITLDDEKHRQVICLPLLLAHFSLTGIPVNWQNNRVYLFKLRQLKAFDELWFNTAFTLSLAYLSQQPHYTTPLQQETAAMIDADENDLVAEIEQQLALATQEVQDLETDVHAFRGNQDELNVLRAENVELITTIEQLGEMITKRDDALKLLLEEVKKLNAKIHEIRSSLKAKQP